MKHFIKLSFYCIILLLLLLLTGCASYIPKSLSDKKNNELAKVDEKHRYNPIVAIDGVRLPEPFWWTRDVYISPGEHEVTYETEGMRKAWVEVGRYTIEENLNYRIDSVTKENKLGYGPCVRKCRLTFQANREYEEQELIEMLINAKCFPRLGRKKYTSIENLPNWKEIHRKDDRDTNIFWLIMIGLVVLL